MMDRDMDDLSWIDDDEYEPTSEELEAWWVSHLVTVLGTRAAAMHIEDHGGFPRGSPDWEYLLSRLRRLRSEGVLAPDAYLFIVTEILRQWEFDSVGDDPVAQELLDRMQAIHRAHGCTTGDEWGRDDQNAPAEYKAADAAFADCCQRALREWLCELGEEEIATLMLRDPVAYERRRASGGWIVCRAVNRRGDLSATSFADPRA